MGRDKRIRVLHLPSSGNLAHRKKNKHFDAEARLQPSGGYTWTPRLCTRICTRLGVTSLQSAVKANFAQFAKFSAQSIFKCCLRSQGISTYRIILGGIPYGSSKMKARCQYLRILHTTKKISGAVLVTTAMFQT